MKRLNITLPDNIANQLSEKVNKSQFIAETLREKFEQEKKEKLNRALIEGYRASSNEDKEISDEWDKVSVEKWD
ncbi:hypothetical protein JXI42_03110 [bacterium]|nr:hypothetical protein [bacterium]